jgi:hypothetical protein
MRCPREAFTQDICSAINNAHDKGDHVILILDGNSDMKESALKVSLEQCTLQEVILKCHGMQGPSTFKHNKTKEAIDGISTTPGLEIQTGGYLAFDGIFQNTDHRCLWIDITFQEAFGHNMPAVMRPKMR